MDPCEKISGADCELGNAFIGSNSYRGSPANKLISVFQAVVESQAGGEIDSNDLGAFYSHRTWVPYNGSCAYVDMGHLEVCLPEVRSAKDHVLYQEAFLRFIGRMVKNMNVYRRENNRDEAFVWAGNSDGHGKSWGTHLNMSVNREVYNQITMKSFPGMGGAVGFFTALSIFLGGGKVSTENGRNAGSQFSLSQRADFMECLIGAQTTYHRPIMNTRDEPHAADDIARLHIIPFDITRLHVNTYLKVGMVQVFLACLEHGMRPHDFMIDDPLEAVEAWNTIGGLANRVGCTTGNSTIVNYLRVCCDRMSAVVDAESPWFDAMVPGARAILDEFVCVLDDLVAHGVSGISDRIQWAAKYEMLRSMGRMTSSEGIDHIRRFESLDPSSIYEDMAGAGVYTTMFTNDVIDAAWFKPPADTRATTRSALLKSTLPVDSVDWGKVTVKLPDDPGFECKIYLPDPAEFADLPDSSIITMDDVEEMLHAERSKVSRGYSRYQRAGLMSSGLYDDSGFDQENLYLFGQDSIGF